MPKFPLDHARVLVRLEEVASADYPFPLPERVKPKNESERINLSSNKNLRPLLASLLRLLGSITTPPLAILLAGLGFFLPSDGTAAAVIYTLAALCLLHASLNPFFLHYVTNGRAGGLGRGAGQASPPPREGIFCRDTPRNRKIRDRLARLADYRPTPYLYSGDLLTLAPFLLFKGSRGGRVAYRRYWVKVPAAPAPDGEDGPAKRPTETTGVGDDEAVALDIAFPQDGYHPGKPTILILHGLNGGSTEPYVLDLARRATKEGHTVAVMVNRGLMKTPVRGANTFHGARTSDVGCAVNVLLHALGGETRFCSENNGKPPSSKIVLVGFSMGGIVAANYAAKAKENSGLAGALSFSGTLCSERMLLATPAASHSISVWQPVLAWGLKATIIRPNMPKFCKQGITTSEVEDVKTVVDIDTELVCKYHGYPTVRHYYEDMSAGGRGDERGLARLKGTKVPLLAVHAIDDPIAIYEVALANEVADTTNVLLLTTKHGGHIGWPRGFFPSSDRWSFMMDIAMEYVDVVCVD